MKLRNLLTTFTAAAFLVAGLAACVTEKEEGGKLEASAKISRVDAEKTALAKVPGGTIKEGGIEKEKGKVIWSFDIATPGSADITEVAVDAMTGEVVSMAKETPAEQEKEKKNDSKEKKD